MNSGSLRLTGRLLTEVVLFALLPGVVAAQAPVSAIESVVTLRVFSPGGTEIATGSGFVIEGGKIVTNLHVVAGAGWVEILDQDGDLVATAPHALALSVGSDLAILPIPEDLLEPLPLSPRELPVGSRVWAIGSPLGFSGTLSEGIVSSYREVEGASLIQVTAPISSGSSGGPVLDDEGQVVGIATASYSNGQNLNFAVPSSAARALSRSPIGELTFPRDVETGLSATTTGGAEEELFSASDYDAALADLPILVVGQAVEGVIGPSDVLFDDVIGFAYRISLVEGEPITLDMWSDEIDPVISVILPEAGQGVIEDVNSLSDDDSGVGLNAHLVVSPLSSGYAMVIASSLSEVRGSFRLLAREGGSWDPPRGSSGEGQPEGVASRWMEWETGQGWAAFVDSQSVEIGNRTRMVWTKRSYYSPESNDEGVVYDEMVARWTLDCSGSRVMLRELLLRLEGVEVSERISLGVPESEWLSSAPESSVEKLLRLGCSLN